MKNQSHEGVMNRSIQTFMKSDYVGMDGVGQYDVAYIWVPVDQGASYRKGQDLAPKSIREHSYWDWVNGSAYYDTDSWQAVTSNSLRICDVGDVHIAGTEVRANQERIIQAISDIRNKCFPLIIGWDHSISYSTIQGCKNALPPEMKEGLGILHFDAHLDMEKPYLDMPKVFHWNPFSSLIWEGITKGENHYAIGQRWMIPSYLMDFVRDNRVNLHTAPSIKKQDYKAFVDRIVWEMKEKFKAVFVTFDIDCIDATEVRGTGTPMEGWLSSLECQYFLRKLIDLPVVGFELVEIAPNLDKSWLTSVIGTNLLWQFLAFGLQNNGKIKL